ncbi:MAG: O-antigen ligase family protein [Acidobacteriota bacterium]
MGVRLDLPLARWAALLPASLVAVFAGWLGTFHGAADGHAAAIGHGILLTALAIWGGDAAMGLVRRPLAAAGALVFVALVLASSASSPVPRAGWTALSLAPAFLVLPVAVARCWDDEARRRIGLLGIAVVTAAVSCWTLLDRWRYGQAEAAMPLGHHNLMAAWLVITVPLSATAWTYGGRCRPAAAVAVVSGGFALAATHSLTGLLALGAAIAVAGWATFRHRGQGRAALAVVAGAGAASALALAFGAGDRGSSMAARLGYLDAAWRGSLEHPWLGWGPGSGRWTLHLHLRPEPGVHPPGEVVADVHSLPLEWLYELGWPAAAVTLGLVCRWWLGLTRRRFCDRALAVAAASSLSAAAVVAVAGLPLAVPALPVALAAAAGAAMAARTAGADVAPPQPVPGAARVGAVLLAVSLGLLQVPRDLAHLAYDQAFEASFEDPEERDRLLDRAVALDPGFPLYRWQRSRGVPALAADGALGAAGAAVGLAPLWLDAGTRVADAERAALAREAWVRACDLDPLGALAPYWLARYPVGDHPKGDAASVDRAARALLAAPQLLAADWRGEEGLLERAVARLEREQGIGAGWRSALVAAWRTNRGAEWGAGDVRPLVLNVDHEPAVSLSLFAFRRHPWPGEVGRGVSVDVTLLPSLGPATAERTTQPELLTRGCGLRPPSAP